MSSYSPFDQELEALEAADLEALTRARERLVHRIQTRGAYRSIDCKSVSAFANTYGGWIFYGVEEESKEDAVAGAFPGIARADADAAQQRIRHAVAGLMNPEAHFDTKVVWGPHSPIGLAENQGIICIRVAQSVNAPHVHKSGQIYRRVADGSEPKPESDRFILDQLFRRADQTRKDYRRWINRQDPELSEGEGENPYLRLMLVADIWHDRDAWLDLDADKVRSFLGPGAGRAHFGCIPFDTIYTSSGGYVARQVKGNNPHNLGLTWRLRPHLVSEVIVPFNFQAPNHPGMIAVNWSGYDHVDRFVKILAAQGHKSPRVIDLNVLFNALLGVAEAQQRLLAAAGWKYGYTVKAKLLNVWRTIPFLDVSRVLDGFEKHGTPMCLDGDVLAPRGTDPETFSEVKPYGHIENEYGQLILQTLDMFRPIAEAFGLPKWLDPNPDKEEEVYYDELQKAGRNAMKVQDLRLKRSDDDD